MRIFGPPKPDERFFSVAPEIAADDPLRAIKVRGHEILSDLSVAATSEDWWARRHRFLNTVLGLPLAILTGVSSVTALATTYRVPAGIIAGVSAILGAVLSFLAPVGKAAYEQRKANDYRSLALALRSWLQLDIAPETPYDEARGRFGDFERRFDEINSRVFSTAGDSDTPKATSSG
jgi:hypothetical protein